MKNNTAVKIGILIVLFLAFTGAEKLWDEFNNIKVYNNPGIYLANGDTISNRTAGTIDMSGSMLRVKGVISDTSITPDRVWYVSPGFTLNTYRKTSPTISSAITNIDSGVIYVYPGIYAEKITAKSRVTIIGASKDRVKIQRTDDTCVVFANGVSNFGMSNMTIQNIYSSGIDSMRNAIKLYKCNNSDSTAVPTLLFDNLRIISTDDEDVSAILADSSKAIFTNCYIKAAGDYSGCVRLRAGSRIRIYNSQIINISATPFSGIFGSEDTRGNITVALCDIYTNNVSYGAIFAAWSSDFKVRIYNNIADGPFSGGSNATVTYLVSSNIYDADFYIP